MKTISDQLKTIIRGLRLISILDKHYLLLIIFTAFLTPVVPYVNIYMMALIVNKLIECAAMSMLLGLVFLTIGINFVFTLLLQLLNYFLQRHNAK